MSHSSRRRVALAAGALLAGSAIPIAAAGTAWADQTSDGNTAPAIPVTAAAPASVEVPSVSPTGAVVTPTTNPFDYPGLTPAENAAIETAVQNRTAVEVSVDGKLVLDTNTHFGAGNVAIATSKNDDTAVAIGGGIHSTADGKGAVAFGEGAYEAGNSDTVKAIGTNANASITDSSSANVEADGAGATAAAGGDVAVRVTATGTDSTAAVDYAVNSFARAADGGTADIDAQATSWTGDFGDEATATGQGSTAAITYAITSSATANHTGNSANNFYGDNAGAYITGSSASAQVDNSSATASDSGSIASVINDGSSAFPVSADHATADGLSSSASVFNASDSSATGTDTGFIRTLQVTRYGFAEVDAATGSTAKAVDRGSEALVSGSSSTLTGSHVVSDSSATAIQGGNAEVTVALPDQSTVTAVTHDVASADGLGTTAAVVDSADSSATAILGMQELNPAKAQAQVFNATDSTARAENSFSFAVVGQLSATTVSDSSNVVTDGHQFIVTDSDVHLVNGHPVASFVEAPVADVHVEPSLVLP